MELQQLSPNSVNASPASVNPHVKTEQTASVPHVNQDVQKSVQASKTDTVTISQQAIQMLASGGDNQAQGVKSGVAQTASQLLNITA